MFNKNKVRHIDLTVPTGWNQCTTAQLEQIAQIILRRTAMQDRYHPYDPVQMKAEAFFALAGLSVMSSGVETSQEISPQGRNDEDETFMVRQGKGEPFPIAVWQVHSFIDQHLGWLDDFTGLLIFPYPTFGRDYGRWHIAWWRPRWLPIPVPYPVPRQIEGPAPLFDGFTWQQYHLASDWLSAYTDGESPETREGFLKALFGVSHLSYTPTRLRRIRPDQFQLCLIWWQSMMAEMQKKYRRCFSKSNSKSSNRQTNLPIDLYTRSTAALQDKYHLTEDEINQSPCRVILQHLEDMAHEAEDLEKINKQRIINTKTTRL